MVLGPVGAALFPRAFPQLGRRPIVVCMVEKRVLESIPARGNALTSGSTFSIAPVKSGWSSVTVPRLWLGQGGGGVL